MDKLIHKGFSVILNSSVLQIGKINITDAILVVDILKQ